MSFAPCDNLLRRGEQHCNAQHLCNGPSGPPGAGILSSIRLVPLFRMAPKKCLGLTLGDKLRQQWPVLMAVDGLIRCRSHSIVAETTFTASHPALQPLDDSL